MALLVTLFIRITIVPLPTFNYVRLVSCMNSLALETADNRILVGPNVAFTKAELTDIMNHICSS